MIKIFYQARQSLFLGVAFSGVDKWSLLDKRDPLVAQHYYAIQDPSMTIVYGDHLAFRCTMVNLGLYARLMLCICFFFIRI